MLSLARKSTSVCSRSFLTRTLATVVPSAISETPTAATTPTTKVPVKEDHGLYAFFRQKADASKFTGEDRYESVGGVVFRSGDSGVHIHCKFACFRFSKRVGVQVGHGKLLSCV